MMSQRLWYNFQRKIENDREFVYKLSVFCLHLRQGWFCSGFLSKPKLEGMPEMRYCVYLTDFDMVDFVFRLSKNTVNGYIFAVFYSQKQKSQFRFSLS